MESTEFHDKRGNHYCLVRKERRVEVEEFLPTDAILSLVELSGETVFMIVNNGQ